MGIKIMQFPRSIISLLLVIALLLPQCLLAEHHKNILLFRAYGDIFSQTAQGIKDDLGDDFNIIEKIIEPETEILNIKHHIDNSKPALIVLIGNTSARLYTRYQKLYPQQDYPPGILISALFADRLLSQIKNAQAIRHEIPAVISISSIRSLLKQPVKRVGVLYREWMHDYIKLNSEFCLKEGIELVKVEVPNRVSVKNLEYHLKHLINEDIDALWIANDNALISSQLIQNVWLPSIKTFNKPIIVGVENLTTRTLNFGTYAVIPDQYALGIQAAGLIGDILDDGIKQFDQNKVYEPVSVKKLLNLDLMKSRNIAINRSKLDTVDKLIH